jgi:hypothetical protein
MELIVSALTGNVARNADGFLDRRQNIEWSCLVAPEPMRTHYC